jgi:hypothetical protein
VAGLAFAAADPFGKLTAMGIRLVTIHTLLKGQRLLEISSGVALHTFDLRMFA